MRYLIRVLVLSILGAIAVMSRASVSLPPVFSAGMVLQRERDAAIWGQASPREKIQVLFRGVVASTVANDAGHWNARIATGAAGGPFEIKVTATNTISVPDVWVGEVWIASGQSNMERKVGQDNSAEDLADARAQAPDPLIRMFTVERNAVSDGRGADVRGSWAGAAPENVETFSSVGYFFARKLRRELNIPIGIIHSSWGGTNAESWLSREALEPLPAFKRSTRNFEKRRLAYEEQLAAIRSRPVGEQSLSASVAPIAPNSLFNGMIAPLAPYAFEGVIWYQGEANIGNGSEYRDLLAALINDWRALWRREFPFLIVQIAPYRAVVTASAESNSALLRDSQRYVAHTLRNSGLVVTADLGHECDVHPTPKKPVGERLAALALRDSYARSIVASGPRPIRACYENGKVRIWFEDIGAGLVAPEWVKSSPKKDRQGYEGYAWRTKPIGEVEGRRKVLDFFLAGEDHVFHSAQATIDGTTVLVSSDIASSPKFVRYGWQEHPIGNLFNADGFPASPFQIEVLQGSWR